MSRSTLLCLWLYLLLIWACWGGVSCCKMGCGVRGQCGCNTSLAFVTLITCLWYAWVLISNSRTLLMSRDILGCFHIYNVLFI